MSNSHWPRVSIIIPCFNNGEYIRESIESALNQTYSNVEVVVINDGSNDNSLWEIKRFAGRVKIIDQPNQGACLARNAGISASTGAFLMFLDGDDLLELNVIEKQMGHQRILEQEKIVFGDALLLHPDGSTESYPRPTMGGLKPKETAKFRNIMLFSPLTSQSLYPVGVIRSVGGFNPEVERGQEHDLNVRLYLNGFDFIYMGDLCYKHRMHQSPTRLSVVHKAKSFYHNIENFNSVVELVKNCPRKYESAENLQVLAEAAWRIARSRLRLGETSIARDFFSVSFKLSDVQHAYGSKLYRAAVILFGPIVAEYIGQFTRPLRMFATRQTLK